MRYAYFLLSAALNATWRMSRVMTFAFLISLSTQVQATNYSNQRLKTFAFVSDCLDTHDSITAVMKENSLHRIAEFKENFKVIPFHEVRTLRRLFYEVQEHFLKDYQLYSTFYETINEGKYDCLTASVLYGIFLEELNMREDLNFTYQIRQTPTHVYVWIRTQQEELIFETTSKDGFIATPKAIAFFMANRKATVGNNELILLENQSINNFVTLEERIALLYFNQGVRFFNQRKFGKCFEMAKKAIKHQDNQAFSELESLALANLN